MTQDETSLLLFPRCDLEIPLWPPGAGGAVAVKEREMSVLPQAHADECRRPHL